MKTIKIEKNKLSEFLQLMILKGDIENKEAILEVKEGSINTKLVSSNKIVALKGVLKGKYQDWGKLGIENLILLQTVITSLATEEIELENQENTLKLSSNNVEFSTILRNTNYIINIINDEKFNSLLEKSLGNEFVLKQDVIKQITNYFNIINPSNLTLSASKKTLTVNLESNQNELKLDFELEKEVQPFTVKLAKFFVDLLSVINEDVICSIKEKAPVYLKIDNDKYKFEYVIAPLSK